MKGALKQRSIVSLIKDDHLPLKKEIRILKSSSATEAQKKKSLSRFLKALKLHAKSEERSLYRPLIDDDIVRDAVLEGYEEHALADLLVMQLERAGFEHHWVDEVAVKAKVLAELVEHHVMEEEQDLLPQVQAAYDATTLRELGKVYTETYATLKRELTMTQKREITSLDHASEFYAAAGMFLNENPTVFPGDLPPEAEVEHESSILLGGSRI